MEEDKKDKWYFKTTSLVTGFLLVGPFILPLVWSNPRFSRKTKTVISVAAVILTLFLTALTLDSVKSIFNYYRETLNPNF